MRKLLLVLWLSVSCIATLHSQSPLVLSEIMKGEEFVGSLPEDIIWSPDSKKIYFHWKESENGVKPYYEYDLELNAITALDAEEELSIPTSGVYNSDRSQMLFEKEGDIFLWNGKEIQQITRTNDYESNPQFLLDGRIVFRKDDNLFTLKTSPVELIQLTDFRKGNEESNKSSEMEFFLEQQQLELFDYISQKDIKNKKREDFEKGKNQKAKSIYLGEENLSSINISPDGQYIYYQTSSTAKTTPTDNLNYVSENGYAEVLKSRDKVGHTQSTEKLYVYQVEKDTFLVFDTKSIPGIFDKPAFYKDYPEAFPNPEQAFESPRKILIHGPDIHENGSAVVEIKSQDNKDRWFMLLDPEKATWSLIERQHDDAWIGGPGIEGWNMVAGNKGWMKDGLHYWYHSEEDGYSHLYKINIKTGKESQITKGKFEIHDAWLSNDKSSFYLISNEEDPGLRRLYQCDLDGKNMVLLTKEFGNHEVIVSPDEKWIASRYSTSNKPWELYLKENKAEAEYEQLTQSTGDDFNSYEWRKPELVYFKADDGKNVRARIYKPAQEKKNGAAVIFVHGAGYLQNVHHWWSGYYREYMFHNLLTDLGYTVLDIDYRASKGYGRDWRCGIYRHMGGLDLSDQVDGAKYLVSEHGIDENRIGIYGGSYGGFITLMALFNEAETFACGAALRSVTDWAHYNHPYTSNILNTPVEDPEAYKKSSPIYFAEGLNDPLVMLHGVVDTNVQFQDIIRLSQKLIELEKKDWDLAVFPVEGHGFKEAKSWTDEYRRILELFEKNLK